jgi:hypothetical protein
MLILLFHSLPPLCSPKKEGIKRVTQCPPTLAFFFHLHYAAGKLYAIRLLDACSQKKGSFKL